MENRFSDGVSAVLRAACAGEDIDHLLVQARAELLGSIEGARREQAILNSLESCSKAAGGREVRPHSFECV